MKGKIVVFLMPAIVGLFLSLTCHAQHFVSDTTLDTDGIKEVPSYTTSIRHRPMFVMPQADNNKFLTAGFGYNTHTVEVMRFKVDGSFDSTFNDDGIVHIPAPYSVDAPKTAFIYDTSKVVVLTTVTGFGGYDILMCNLLSNGQLNPAFGTGGIAHVALSESPVYSMPVACSRMDDGKFMVLGKTIDPGTGVTWYVLSRLLPDGSRDMAYGATGWKRNPYPLLSTPCYGTVSAIPAGGYLQADKKYVVAGSFRDSIATYHGDQVFVVRHKPDGSPDTTFGNTAGIAIAKNAAYGLTALAIDADALGKYYVLARVLDLSGASAGYNFAVIKLKTNGQYDSTYGTDGVSYLNLPFVSYTGSGFAVQKNGRAVISGTSRSVAPGADAKLVIYRLDAAGVADTSFNTGGFVTGYRPGSTKDHYEQIAIQKNGAIMSVGWDSVSGTGICMRFANYADPTASFTPVLNGFSAFSATIFPNPASDGNIQIRYTNTQSANTGLIAVVDGAGRIVLKETIRLRNGDGALSLRLPDETPSGTYFVMIQDGLGERNVQRLSLIR